MPNASAQVVGEMSKAERSALMKFATSVSRAPLGGFKHLNPPLTVHKARPPCSMRQSPLPHALQQLHSFQKRGWPSRAFHQLSDQDICAGQLGSLPYHARSYASSLRALGKPHGLKISSHLLIWRWSKSQHNVHCVHLAV